MSYDTWKTTPPPMPSGNGRVDDRHCRCTACDFKGNAGEGLRHHRTTGHVVTWKGHRQACCCADRRHDVPTVAANQ